MRKPASAPKASEGFFSAGARGLRARPTTAGISREKAITEVDTIDGDRAAFIKRYLKLNWPEYHLYNAMFNTEMGDSYVAEMLAHCAQQVAH